METNIFKNILKLSGSTTITQIMGVLILPMLSRLYSPEDFGTFALFISISNILLIIGTWQYHMAIVIPKDYEESISLFYLSILLLSIMSILFLIILMFFKGFIINLLELKNVSNLFFLIPIYIFISGVYYTLRVLNSKNNNFGNSAKSSIVNSGVTYLVQIVYGIVFINSLGLVYGSILGICVATIFLLIVSLKFIPKKSLSFTNMEKVIYKYKKFPTFNTLGGFIETLGNQLPVLLLSSFFGAIYTGFFSMSNKVITIPIRIIGGSISEVSFKHISDVVDENKRLSNYLEKSMAGVLQISIIPFLIILLFGRLLVNIFLGEQWAFAGLYAQILSPLGFFQLLSSPIGVFLQKKRNDLMLKMHIVHLLFSIIGLGSGYFLGSAIMSIINFSLLCSISSILYIYLNFRLAEASFKSMFYHFRTTFYLKKFISQIGKRDSDPFI